MSLRKSLKKIGRKAAKTLVKVNRGITVVAAGVGTYLGGPVVGAAVTAAGAVNGQYLRATQARNEGKHGRDARSLGRGERKRVAIYGGAAATLGLGTSVAAGALGWAGTGAGGNALAGTAGSNLFWGTPATSTFVTAGNLASQPGLGVPGLVTESSLNASLGGAAGATGGAGVGTGLGGAVLSGALGALGKLYPLGDQRTDKTPMGGLPKSPADMLGGGGGSGETGAGGQGSFFNSPAEGGGLSGGAIAAIGLGALLLLS